ncbi:MAG TPA: DUF423 domain-containing protein [Steroidobacteraceae bacterium]|jgi:uncharacterized membrane protein YgdD (TMEM256/DUF423 family)|nr:DUF423 domain-containing protein [Steroidobacteraceae bacterium]
MMGAGVVGAARSARWILVTGGAFMALATICGALGAHALPGRLTAGQLEIYDTGVRFQFFQALGLLVLGTVARGGYNDGLRAAAWLLVGGIVTFCGSLYLLAFHITLGAPLVVGLITPLGGILLIAGWVMFAVTSWRLRRAA